jgi:hypothetical protein
MMIRSSELNAQEQSRFVWPASSAVARAYIDQLGRTHGIQPERARAVNTALDGADRLRTGREKGAASALSQLDAVASQLERDAGLAGGHDAARLRSLAATIRGRAAKLRS